jgi:YXWGXW repeat-containing protein
MRAYIEVPYPPPAALVEVVPPEPDVSGVVWLDGHWVWRGTYYVWQRGGWMVPPKDGAYATWQSLLAKDGRIVFAPGTWYGPDRRPLTPPKMLTTARTPPNQTTIETKAAR